MKVLARLIGIVIVFGIIALLFFMGINKTFIYDIYKTETMNGNGISINRFTYFVSESNELDAKFISLFPTSTLNNKKNEYLNKLTNCYGKYYYDEENEITILQYKIMGKGLYRTINIKYIDDNYCSEDYVLKDPWIPDYNSHSKYASGDITKDSVEKIIDKISTSNRVDDPKITNYVSKISYKVLSIQDGIIYEYEFKDFSENEIAVIRDDNSYKKMAVYNISDVVSFLKSLELSSKN